MCIIAVAFANPFPQDLGIDTESSPVEVPVSNNDGSHWDYISTIDDSKPDDVIQSGCTPVSLLDASPEIDQDMTIFRRHTGSCPNPGQGRSIPPATSPNPVKKVQELWRKFKGPTANCPNPERQQYITCAGPEVFGRTPMESDAVLNCVWGQSLFGHVEKCCWVLIVPGKQSFIKKRGLWNLIEDPYLAQYCCVEFKNSVSLIGCVGQSSVHWHFMFSQALGGLQSNAIKCL